ncbi:hypothetical protein BGZ63DRAFT_384603 [Mariannaea sp. PMI_226]|nr:hypothetical protein BGZ63DRAFT_384603 [Mariannaea sp. PMI_226]
MTRQGLRSLIIFSSTIVSIHHSTLPKPPVYSPSTIPPILIFISCPSPHCSTPQSRPLNLLNSRDLSVPPSSRTLQLRPLYPVSRAEHGPLAKFKTCGIPIALAPPLSTMYTLGTHTSVSQEAADRVLLHNLLYNFHTYIIALQLNRNLSLHIALASLHSSNLLKACRSVRKLIQ